MLIFFCWSDHSSATEVGENNLSLHYYWATLSFAAQHCTTKEQQQQAMLPILARGWREHSFLLMDFWKIPSKISSTEKQLKDHEDNSSTAWLTSSQHWNLFSQTWYFIPFISHSPHRTPRAAKIHDLPILSVATAESGNCSVVKCSTVT